MVTVPLPRFDGKTLDPINSPKSPDGDWEIEDFFPPEVMMEAVNLLLKKEKYKKISSIQIQNRSKEAFIKKGILAYAEECCSSNNPDRPSLALEDEGRKIQLCRILCDLLPQIWERDNLKFKIQTRFIKSLNS